MGQNQSRHRDNRQRNEGRALSSVVDRTRDSELYRSRSTRSFADITVSAFRRTLRRLRDWLLQKNQRKVEVIELSPMSTASGDAISIEEALEAHSLEEVETFEINGHATILPHLNEVPIEEPEENSPTKVAIELQEVKKLEFLDFAFLEDEDTVRWIKKNRVVFVLRGLPGSGKSTLVNAITQVYDCQSPIVCSADHYFLDKDGIYRFDSSRLQDAHETSQSLMNRSCQDGKKMIIVDNTNVQNWEMRPYFVNANRAPFTYRVIVIEPKTPWKLDAQVLAEKNSHNVPFESLRKKANQFDLAVPIYFGWFLSPCDSRSLYDRVMILFKNIYHCCDEFKQSFGKFSSMLNWGSAMNFYSRDMMTNGRHDLHCTAKFCGFQKKDSKQNPSITDYMKKRQVQENLGLAQRLKIIGFFFTKETVGCRVVLTEEQLEMYDQEEKSGLQRQYGKPSKEQKNKDDYKESVTIEELFDDHQPEDRFKPLNGKGRKAHITIATAPGVRPVNTGIDLLEIVQAEQNEEEQYSFDIPDSQDVLRLYPENFWVVYLNEALSVEAIFTGYY